MATRREPPRGPTSDNVLDKGLPQNTEAERFVLGAVLMDDSLFVQVAGGLTESDFSLEKHRRIFARMNDLFTRHDKIDRVTLTNELSNAGQLESVDGLSYIVSLDEGLPALANLESYIRIVKSKAVGRRIIHDAQRAIESAVLQESDPYELAGSLSQSLLDLSSPPGASRMVTAAQVIDNYPEGVNAFLSPKATGGTGLRTGFSRLDEMTGGLHGGDLIVIGARPSFGKTALALNIATFAAITSEQNARVPFFSLEMTKEALVQRVVCAVGRVDSQKFRMGYLDQDERRRLLNAKLLIDGKGLYIDDSHSTTIMEISAKCRKLHREEPLSMVVIDYLGLLVAEADNRAAIIGQITRHCKLGIAKQLGVPVILLVQLSRACDVRPGDHRPILSDIRESGNVEQDADVVLFLWRPEFYKRDREELKGTAELILAKQRQGPTGTVKLVFLKEYVKFESRAEDFGEEEPQ